MSRIFMLMGVFGRPIKSEGFSPYDTIPQAKKVFEESGLDSCMIISTKSGEAPKQGDAWGKDIKILSVWLTTSKEWRDFFEHPNSWEEVWA